MSLKQFRLIPPENRPEKLPNTTRLVSAGGDDLNVVGVYNLKLTVGGRSIFSPVFVCKGLHSSAILGIDSQAKLGVSYSAAKRVFFFDDILDEPNAKKFVFQNNMRPENFSTEISTISIVKIPPLCHATVCMNTMAGTGYSPPPGAFAVTEIGNIDFPTVTSNPGVVQINAEGKVYLQLFNQSTMAVEIPRNVVLGHIELVHPNRLHVVDKKMYLESIEKAAGNFPPPPSVKDRDYVFNNIKITVPDSERQAYVDLIEKNHDIFSKNESDLGCANHFKHKITLKDKSPIYVKQFRVAEAYRAGLFEQVKTWLALGIIKPSQSKWNSPIFVVPKKSGKPRYVLDYRQLNAASVEDKYSMRTVDECIADIGFAGSTIFSIMDLSAAFHQQLLDDESSEYTSFTVPPLGQFKFARTSMGLNSSPANFQRMMELAMIGLSAVIVYFDDLLVHNKTHSAHRAALQEVFSRLRKCNLKLNPLKCHFGTQNVDYLGFRLTPQGILPGIDKLKCVRDAPAPTNVTQIKQFLGLANFFRTHVRNFSLISSPLTKLTRKDSQWKSGPLPEDAQKSFFELKSALISEPCLAYPRSNRDFTLIVDSAIGSATSAGGLGAILCQTDEQGQLHPISYASRSLQKHECNYSAFLIELTGCVFGIEHFSNYLKGRRFQLLTDHKPLVDKLSAVHSKTLNRLQFIMMDYDFEIKYLKGEIIPADYLSRNVLQDMNILEEIDIFSTNLPTLQSQDEFCVAVLKFLQKNELPSNGSKANYIKQIAPHCFVENDVLWRRMHRLGMPTRTVLVVPRSLCADLVKETHGTLFVGHNGVEKCRERLLQSYFWPNMEKDVKMHLDSCTKCQSRKKTGHAQNFMQPMPQCTAPNQRVHVDIFGPLMSTKGKKYILTATDGFTKYCEAWAIDNKTAENVSRVLFEKYICRYGCMQQIFSDCGTEFVNKLSDELYKLLQIKHNTTTAYRAQANSTSEIFNKTIAKYLASFVDSKTTNWIDYINPMLFAYNTSYHSTTKCTPHFLTYGQEARYPSNPTNEIQHHYGDTTAAQWFQQLQEARTMATHNSIEASEKSRVHYDKNTSPIVYTIGQLVWLNEFNFLGKNRKLSANWSGPYPIVKIFQGVVDLKLPRRSIRVNVNRIKPYIAPVQLEARLTDLPAVNIFVENRNQNNVPNFEQRIVQNQNPPNVAVETNRPRHIPDKEIRPRSPQNMLQEPNVVSTDTNKVALQTTNVTVGEQVVLKPPKTRFGGQKVVQTLPQANEKVVFPSNDIPFRIKKVIEQPPPTSQLVTRSGRPYGLPPPPPPGGGQSPVTNISKRTYAQVLTGSKLVDKNRLIIPRSGKRKKERIAAAENVAERNSSLSPQKLADLAARLYFVASVFLNVQRKNKSPPLATK